MKRTWPSPPSPLLFAVAPLSAAGLTGQYIEARTTDVWTGPCFANADVNIGGKHAIMAWKVEKGEFDKVNLNGLGMVAVVAASDTLGNEQTGPAKAVLIVDDRATSAQRDGPDSAGQDSRAANCSAISSPSRARIDLNVCNCAEGGCGMLTAGDARIETGCLDHKHDKVCGNESAFFPPLARDVKVQAALAVENTYSGKGVDSTWKDSGRRSAYLGTFAVR